MTWSHDGHVTNVCTEMSMTVDQSREIRLHDGNSIMSLLSVAILE